MGFWAFVECGWCGFYGCASPTSGDDCPRCHHPLTPPTPPKAPDPVTDGSA